MTETATGSPARTLDGPCVLTLLGCAVFVLVLALSAAWDPTIRWLHFFQAWMYAATMVLAVRQVRFGWFIGFAAALFWAYEALFVVSFVSNGLKELVHWGQGGAVRWDQLIAVPAWLANAAIIAGCTWAYCRSKGKSGRDVALLLLAFALTMGFFAVDMALFQPRFLGVFSRLFSPHLPAW